MTAGRFARRHAPNRGCLSARWLARPVPDGRLVAIAADPHTAKVQPVSTLARVVTPLPD